MNAKKLLIGMYRACLEYAELVRLEHGPHWSRKWERAMQDAALTRRMIAAL